MNENQRIGNNLDGDLTEINLGNYAAQIERRKFLVGGLGAIGLFGAAGVIGFEKIFPRLPLSQAVERVEFRGSNKLPLPVGMVNDDIQMMTGNTVLLTVAEKLGFQVDKENGRPLEKIPFSVKAKLVAPGSALVDVFVECSDPELALAATDEVVKATQQRMDETQAARYSAAKESSDRIAALQANKLSVEPDGNRLFPESSTDLITVIEKARLLDKLDAGISRTASLLAGGGVIGVAAGVAWVLWNRVLINPEQANEILGYPVLGEIYKLKKSSDLLSPRDMNMEAFRRLRIGLDKNNNSQVVIVGSAERGEGKSTVALGLAKAYHEVDEKVLVIDCDLGNPSIPTRTGLSEGSAGLSDLMKDTCDLEQLIQKVPGNDFSVLTAGTLQPENLQNGFFGTDAFRKLIITLKQDYRRIILDSPPYMAGTDMLSIAQASDEMLFVVSSGSTKSKPAIRVLNDIARMAKCSTGLVMNNLPLPKGNRYYGG